MEKPRYLFEYKADGTKLEKLEITLCVNALSTPKIVSVAL